MKSEKLANIYKCMKRDGLTRYGFEVKYNENLIFDVIFIAEGQPYQLLIGAKGWDKGFIVQVLEKDDIKTFLDLEHLNTLKEILGIQKGRYGKFDTTTFFKVFCDNIPDYVANKSNIELNTLRKYKYKNDAEEDEGKYFSHWKDNKKTGDTVSDENLEKTKRLLGHEIYLFCKKYNISSCWTSKPKKTEISKINEINDKKKWK